MPIGMVIRWAMAPIRFQIMDIHKTYTEVDEENEVIKLTLVTKTPIRSLARFKTKFFGFAQLPPRNYQIKEIEPQERGALWTTYRIDAEIPMLSEVGRTLTKRPDIIERANRMIKGKETKKDRKILNEIREKFRDKDILKPSKDKYTDFDEIEYKKSIISAYHN